MGRTHRVPIRKIYPPPAPPPAPLAHCDVCGYSFRGHCVGERCPECGREVVGAEIIAARRAYRLAADRVWLEQASGCFRWACFALLVLIALIMVGVFRDGN
jgi:hypothetical protein